MNNQAIFCVTEKGIEIAKVINKKSSSDIFILSKFYNGFGISFDSLKDLVNEVFFQYKSLIFIMATGIVVRVIAPNISKKDIDPAVISIDEQGNFVIPLLSGHLGGANNKARELSAILKGIPVITTATDISGKIAVDTLAQNLNCKIDELESAKKLTSLVLQNKEISLFLPENIKINGNNSEGIILLSNRRNIEVSKIVPQNISVGIGCKRGTSLESLESFLRETFENLNLDIRSIKVFNSCWVKSDEIALIELSKKFSIDINFYSKDEIEKIEYLIEDKSEFVKKELGIYGVSEPCAFLGSNQKGKFLAKKLKKDGITLSLFEEE